MLRNVISPGSLAASRRHRTALCRKAAALRLIPYRGIEVIDVGHIQGDGRSVERPGMRSKLFAFGQRSRHSYQWAGDWVRDHRAVLRHEHALLGGTPKSAPNARPNLAQAPRATSASSGGRRRATRANSMWTLWQQNSIGALPCPPLDVLKRLRQPNEKKSMQKQRTGKMSLMYAVQGSALRPHVT